MSTICASDYKFVNVTKGKTYKFVNVTKSKTWKTIDTLFTRILYTLNQDETYNPFSFFPVGSSIKSAWSMVFKGYELVSVER